MARCTNCNHKWKVKDILLLGFSKHGKKCAYCLHKQYISGKTQRLFTLGYVSILFVPFLIFYIKLSDKDEPLV